MAPVSTASVRIKWMDGSMVGGGMTGWQTDRGRRSSYPYIKSSPGLAIHWLCCVAMSPNLSECHS